jgi:hypothetical protein
MNRQCRDILERSEKNGWVLEPEAKMILRQAGLDTPVFHWIRDMNEIEPAAQAMTFPLIAKVVSPEIMHKSERGGVIQNITGAEALIGAYKQFSLLEGFAGMLVEEAISGVEVIMGAQRDPQFGMVALIGIGGTSVELYRDVAMRLAPVTAIEARKAMAGLKGLPLLQGYRGAEPVDLDMLAGFFSRFSRFACDLGGRVASIDLNPVICSGNRALIADARILF